MSSSRDPAPMVCIALGSNLGDRQVHLRGAVNRIEDLPGTRVLMRSGLHETIAVGPAGQGDYLNAAIVIETTLGARELLGHLQDIERCHGRDREHEQRWGARTLDLDLLLYGDLVLDEEGITVPHPRMHERLFVLAPLREIAPDAIVPTLARTVGQLHDEAVVRNGGASP